MTQYYVRKFIDPDEAAAFTAMLVDTKGVPVDNIKVFEKMTQYYKFSRHKYPTTIVKWKVEQ